MEASKQTETKKKLRSAAIKAAGTVTAAGMLLNGAVANYALSLGLGFFSRVFGGSILTFLFQFALLFGLFALVLKLLFPRKKLKDLLTKKSLLGMALAALALTTADMVLKTWYEPYAKVRALILLILALILLSLLAWRILYRRKRPAPQAQEATYEIV